MNKQDTKNPISFDELKQAAREHFGTRYMICHLKYDKPLVAMLCNVGKPVSKVRTWLYVAKDEAGRHYIVKRRTNVEGVELTELLTERMRAR